MLIFDNTTKGNKYARVQVSDISSPVELKRNTRALSRTSTTTATPIPISSLSSNTGQVSKRSGCLTKENRQFLTSLGLTLRDNE